MNRLLGKSSKRDDKKPVKGFISPNDTYTAIASKLVSDVDTENIKEGEIVISNGYLLSKKL